MPSGVLSADIESFIPKNRLKRLPVLYCFRQSGESWRVPQQRFSSKLCMESFFKILCQYSKHERVQEKPKHILMHDDGNDGMTTHL